MNTFKITACQEEYTTYWVQGKDEDDASENWADNGYDSDKKRINNSILTILYIEEETPEEIAQ